MNSKKFSFGDLNRKIRETEPAKAVPQEEPRADLPRPEPRAAVPLPPPKDPRSEKTESSRRGSESGAAVRQPGAAPRKPQLPNPVVHDSADAPKGIDKIEVQDELDFDIFRYLAIIIQRKKVVLLITLLMTAFCIVQYLRGERLYTTHARLLFKPEDRELINIDNGSGSYPNMGNREAVFNTHLELLKSKTVLTLVSDNLGDQVSPLQIGKHLSITQGQTNREKNDIIELGYSNSNPQLARDVLNELCRTYIDYRLEVNSQEVTKLLFKLDQQINKFQAELDKKESDLRRFKEENRMVQLSDETNLTVSKLADMELDLQKTDLTLAEGRQKYSALSSQIGKQDRDIVQSYTYSDPIKEKIAALELEYNTLTADNSPEHYKVKMVRQQIDHLKAAAKDSLTRDASSKTFISNPIRQSLVQDLVNLNVDRSSLEAKRGALQQSIGQLNGEIMKLPAVEQRYAFLQRETESLVQTLKLLKSKYEDAQIRRDAQETDIKILELADLPGGAVPNVKFITIIMGLLVGLLLGIAIAFVLEYLDQSVKDPIQVERILDLPLLGIVPLIDTSKALLQQHGDLEKKILEPFRSLRANLKHLADTHNSKVFMICSAIKGEGKTTLAANLAITFAVDGKKIILVDADLRRSQLHNLFSIPKETGLTDYLLGTKTADDIMKPCVLDNLYIITSGERPPNPAELVGTERFDQLVKDLRERADIIIFDSPALLPVSDALTMAPKMDGSVMVFRTGWTPLKAARQAKHQIARIGCTIYGGIFNGVSLNRSYYPYYYGYYGYYSYSKYTYEDDQQKKKLPIREFGLKVEDSLRRTLRSIRYGIPKYIASPRAFARYLAKKKTFWMLLVLLCGLSVAELWIGMHHSKRGHEPGGIVYLGPAGHGSPAETPAATIPVSTSAPESAAQAAAAAATPSGTPAATAAPQAGAPATTATPPITGNAAATAMDNTRKWFDALKAGSMQDNLALYDSAGFRFSGGGFDLWEPRVRNYFAQNQGKRFILENIWQSSVQPSFIETRLAMTVIGADTARVIKALSWKNGPSGWKIIGEKTKTAG